MAATKAEIPFVDFYTAHRIIPTRQDISDLQKHVERRHSLYRHLGLPPLSFRDASVLEFGPGSGHNAVVTGLLGPRRYLLVDGNSPSLESTRKLLKQYCPKLPAEFRQSSIIQFRDDEKFDVVLCEAVIPTQKNPPRFLRHVASFVRPGGVFVFTCMDALSLLPEMLRRWVAARVTAEITSFDAKVAALVEFFKPDVKSLPGMSRRPEDWVIDQILHPWVGPLFSIPEAAATLGTHAALLGCSPRFLQDWRWYKTITGSGVTDAGFIHSSYYQLALNLMDYRVELPAAPRPVVERVAVISQRIYDRIFAQERGQASFTRTQLEKEVRTLSKLLAPFSPLTAKSLLSFARYLRSSLTDRGALADFRPWWGRGQQYLSFVAG